MVRIKYVNYGVANVIQGEIYMNRSLLKDTILHNTILRHEVSHVLNPGKSVRVDWDDLPPFGLTRWMLSHPSSWMQLLPVWYMGGRLIYSRFMLLYWFLILILMLSGVFIVWLMI